MKNKRLVFLDILRIIAALTVILYHILISSVSNDPSITSQIGMKVMAIASMMQWHIPIFFMITGYLWLDKNKECTYSSIIHNIRRFIISLISFGFVYAIMERVFYSNSFSAKNILLAISDIFTGNLWDHMWFLYTIIGIYLILPIIKPFYDNTSNKYIWICCIILFAFAFIIPATEYIWQYKFPINFPTSTPIFYVFAGGLLNRINVKNRKIPLLLLLTNSIFIFTINYFNLLSKGIFPILISISAFCLFILIKDFFENHKEIPFIYNVSLCTFGIYLIHPLFINLVIKLFNINPLHNYPVISVTALWIITTVFSYLITYLLRKIYFIKKYVL